jgi:hypothetical protein
MRDFFGVDLHEGDFVLLAGSYTLTCHKVLYLTDRMVKTANIFANTTLAKKGALRYAKHLVKVDPQLVTFKVLQNTQSTE